MSCGKERCDGGCVAGLGNAPSGNCFVPIGRAASREEKRAVMEKILAAWEAYPNQRLGQFLFNANRIGRDTTIDDIYNIEDKVLADRAHKYGRG